MGSARFSAPDQQPAGYLLIGDSASIPGINGIVATVPDDVPIEMYLEQHDDNDTLIPLAEHRRLRAHWVARNDEESLAEAIDSRDWSNWYAWATPEAASLKHVRRRLRDVFGFPRPRYTPRPTGARAGRWARAAATSPTLPLPAEWRVFAE